MLFPIVRGSKLKNEYFSRIPRQILGGVSFRKFSIRPTLFFGPFFSLFAHCAQIRKSPFHTWIALWKGCLNIIFSDLTWRKNAPVGTRFMTGIVLKLSIYPIQQVCMPVLPWWVFGSQQRTQFSEVMSSIYWEFGKTFGKCFGKAFGKTFGKYFGKTFGKCFG